MKLRSLTITLLLALTVSTLTAAANTQAPETEWEKTFGGSGDDYGYSVQQTNDGGYIIAGLSDYVWSKFGDAYLIKTDADGNLLWERTFGGPNYDQAWCVQQTSDGGYIIAGEKDFVSAWDPRSDAFLIKTDSDGGLQWERTFDRGSWRDCGLSVQLTTDGGYIMAGFTSNGWALEDVYLVKTDADGNLQWENTFGGVWSDTGRSVQQTTDGGYIIVGSYDPPTTPRNVHDVYLIKTRADGTLVWEKKYGGSEVDYGHSVQQTNDGGYIIAGDTESYGAGGDDAWLIKTNSDGILQWDKTFGGSQGDHAASVRLTSDGGYMFAGRTQSYGAGDWDVYLVKTDAEGNLLWQKTFGGSQYDGAWAGSVLQQTSDGGLIITGSTKSFGADADVYLIKVKPEVIPSFVDVDPDTLNLKSNGQWITVYIELPEGYSVEDMDLDSVELLNEDFCLPAVTDPKYDFVTDPNVYIVDHDGDGVLERLAKFDRAALVEHLGAVDLSEYESGKFCDVSLMVSGELSGGPVFEGSDTIRVK